MPNFSQNKFGRGAGLPMDRYLKYASKLKIQ